MEQAIVIGGGLAGAAVAARLAQAGRDVVLLEREARAGHKVCGEFLSYEAGLYLERLGLDPHALGAVPITAMRLFSGRASAEAELPFKASSLSRKVLDDALLRHAEASGAQVRRGVRVMTLEGDAKGWTVRTDAGETITSPDVFLATGKHDLRDWRRPPGRQSDLIGFKMHWRLTPSQTAALGDRVEIHLFPGGYAGLEPVEDGIANLCLVVRRSDFVQIGRSWEALLAQLVRRCSTLAARLASATACFRRPLAIGAIPYGYVCARGGSLWRLGDQAAVIPSFSGDGMSIALHSAHRAADLFLAGRTADVFQRALARDLRAQVARATRLSQTLVRPWAQPTLAAAARVRPKLLSGVAEATRISARALAGAPG